MKPKDRHNLLQIKYKRHNLLQIKYKKLLNTCPRINDDIHLVLENSSQALEFRELYLLPKPTLIVKSRRNMG